MSILRIDHNRENPFVMLNKTCLAEKTLSWAAKGLWAYLMSMPDNWNVCIAQLSSIYENYGGGEKAIYKCLNELIENGYCLRSQTKNDSGKFEKTEYTVLEFQIILPLPDLRDADVTRAEKEGLIKTEAKTKTEVNEYKVNDPLPPKISEPETPVIESLKPVIESLNFQTQNTSHCFSSSEDDVLAVTKKFKLDEQQAETFRWLALQGINTDLETLSWWASNNSIADLQKWINVSRKKAPTNIGGYLRRLLEKKAIVPTEESAQAAEFIKEYLESNTFFDFKISEKYAVLHYPDGNQKEIFLFSPIPTIKMQLDTFLDVLENYKGT